MAGNVRWWCLSLFLLLFAAAGLLGADLSAEDLVNNEENNITTTLFPCAVEGVFHDLCEYPSGLAWSRRIHHATTVTGNTTLLSSTFAVSVVGTPCHGSLAMLYDMVTAYILQYPRLLDALAVAIMCFYLFALSAGASAIARRKRPRNIQRRKLLAKKQRLRLLAIRFATTTTGTEDWRQLSAKIATLSETISLLRKNRPLGKSRGRRRPALARLSLQRQAADTASGGLFIDILAMFSLASRRPSPRRQSKDVDDGIVGWVLLGGCLGLLCVVDCVGLVLLRYEQFIWNGLSIISAWYLPDVLWTLQEWMMYFRSQARRRVVRLYSDHNLRDELQSRPGAAVASVTAQAPAAATAEATRHNEATVAAGTARAESEESSDTIAGLSPTMGIQPAVPAGTAAELQLARRQASVADTTTTTSADATASSEISLAPHRAKSSTSTTTAAWLGCNATMRDRSDASTTEARLRAELAEQASAADAAAAGAAAAAAAAAIVASSKIAAAKEETSIANSRARTAEQECITVRRERDQERADNAHLRAELRKRDSAAITAEEELVTAREQVVCATSAANKDAEGRALAEIGRAGAAEAATKLRASLEQKTKVATAATEELAAARKEIDRLSFGANKGTARYLTLEHERDTAVVESVALWEKVATQTAATATAKRESEKSRQKADRSALAADACAERCHVVELELADALAESSALRIALATRTAATDTATEDSETPREKADHQALAADAYAERYHVVKLERDGALAQSAALQKKLETQTAATATATKNCEAAWKENARAAFASKEIALERDMSARASETAGARIIVQLRAMLEEQTAATATASRALKASQKQVSRAALLHTVKFSKLGEPRIRKSTVARMRVKHRHAADAAENKLTVALNNGSRAVEEAVKVTLERDKIKATLVKVQAALHRTQKKFGIRATTREDLLAECTDMQPMICAALLFLSVLLVSGQRRNYYA